MHPVSRGVLPLTTQGASLRRNSSSGSRTATVAARPEAFRERVRERTEKVRRAVLDAALYGFNQRVASLMEWRKERLSREQNGSDRLTVELVLAEALAHEEEGRPQSAAKILEAFQRKQTPVIRLRDGQYLLEFE